MIARRQQPDARPTRLRPTPPPRRGLAARLAVAAASLLTLASGPAALAQSFNTTPAPIQGLKVVDKRGQKLPLDLQFTTSEGRVVQLGDLFDGKRPVVMVLMYLTCPVVCPTVMQQAMVTFNDLDFKLGKDYRVIFVSFDSRDKPEAMAKEKETYLLSYARPRTDLVRESVTFLSSEPQQAHSLGDALGFPFRYLPQSATFSHATGMFLLTPDGTVSRFIGGLQYPAKDVRLGLLEASKGGIGDVFDQVTLFCYCYNPKTGSYSLQAFRVMQLAGVATMLILGGFVAILFIGERRKRRRNAAAAAEAPSESGPMHEKHLVGHPR